MRLQTDHSDLNGTLHNIGKYPSGLCDVNQTTVKFAVTNYTKYT